MKIYKVLARAAKCLLAAFFAVALVFFAWIAREAVLSAYEPRGFISEYDRDMSQFFPAWTPGAEGGISEAFVGVLCSASALDEAAAFSGARIRFDFGKIAGWQFFFGLKKIGSFRGTLEVSSSGHAAATYVHRHFAEPVRPMKQEDALRQLSDMQRQADEIGSVVSYAMVSAGKNAYYGGNGELLREYSYE